MASSLMYKSDNSKTGKIVHQPKKNENNQVCKCPSSARKCTECFSSWRKNYLQKDQLMLFTVGHFISEKKSF